MTRWTSVVSYHTDPEVCGVARFSQQLAERLGVPLRRFLEDEWYIPGETPLLSLKWAELSGVSVSIVRALGTGLDQLWHDPPPEPMAARRVWRLYQLGVPALVQPSTLAPAALFTFGMAHRLEVARFLTLKAQRPDDQLWVSTATHEGAGPSRIPELMAAWGPSARNLGTLSDDALGLVWPRVTALVAFFAHGLRANNTTVHAALDAGVPVITNWDEGTPHDLRRVTHDYRTDLAPVLPRPSVSPYTWDRLLKELGCASGPSAAVA